MACRSFCNFSMYAAYDEFVHRERSKLLQYDTVILSHLGTKPVSHRHKIKFRDSKTTYFWSLQRTDHLKLFLLREIYFKRLHKLFCRQTWFGYYLLNTFKK